MILTNAVLAKSACQSLIQFADRLFSAIYIIEDCNIHKNPRLYLQLIANHLGFLFETEFFQPHYFFTDSEMKKYHQANELRHCHHEVFDVLEINLK